MSKYSCDSCMSKLCAKKVPIFSFLSDDELRKIITMTGHLQFKKGEALCYEGESSDTLFIINEGKVKLSKITKDGKEQIVHILSSGDFFGELNLFNDEERYNFSGYAISNVKICTISKKDMDYILIRNPEISLKILKEVAKKLTSAENLAQNLATNDAEIRIAHMILEFSERYGKVTREGIKIELPINREEMANYCGITRETISRKLSIFEELDIIDFIGNKILIIKDEKSLRKYVE